MSDVSFARADDKDKILNVSRQQKKVIDQFILPALKNKQDGRFYESYGKFLNKASAALIEHVEKKASADDLASPFDHFIDLQIKLVEQGVETPKTKYTYKQAMFLIKGYNRRLVQFLNDMKAMPFMQDPISVSIDWKESRDQFWEAHVIHNEFANYRRLIQFGLGILTPHMHRIQAIQKQKRLLELEEFEANARKLTQTQQELTERSMEARLIRFQRSVTQVGGDTSFKDKLVNAMSLALDSDALLGFLASKKLFTRDAFKQPELVQQIQQQYTKVSLADPKIIEQARLLREGSHWWLRGRYGRGALANGLLKPKTAMASPYQMNALYMPRQRPNGAVDAITKKQGAVGTFHRRHYYTWAVEEGDLTFELVNRSSRENNPNQGVSQATFFY